MKTLDDWYGDNYMLMKKKFAACDFNGDSSLDHGFTKPRIFLAYTPFLGGT